METYGYKKGAMKKALGESMQGFASPRVVDWDSFTGPIKAPEITSAELQHKAWSDVD
jgi:hypothetical protein